MIFLYARHTWCIELVFSGAPLCFRNVTLSLSQLLFVTSWSCCLLTRCVWVGRWFDFSSSWQAQRWCVVFLVLWCNWIARSVQCLALAKPFWSMPWSSAGALLLLSRCCFPTMSHRGVFASLLCQAASSQGSRRCTEDSWCASSFGREPAEYSV